MTLARVEGKHDGMIEPRSYQVPAIEALSNCDLGHIVSKAGSGKTIMVAFAIKMREARELKPLKVLWLAGTRELLDQGREACEAVGLLGSQTFACYQGAGSVSNDVDIAFVDECHGVGCPTYKTLLRSTLLNTDGKWTRSCITWGATATPERTDEIDIVPIIGPMVYRVPERAIKDAGGVLDGRYTIREFNTPNVTEKAKRVIASKVRHWMNDEQVSRVTWQAVLSECVTHCPDRDGFIASIVREFTGQSVLCLCDTVAQCQVVADLVDGAVAFHSGMGAKKRRDTLESFRSGEVPVLICTSVADEGFDVPIASVLVMARAGKAKGRTEQRVGRVLRPYKDQTSGLVVDIKDLSHKMLEVQHYQRVRLYKQWRFARV